MGQKENLNCDVSLPKPQWGLLKQVWLSECSAYGRTRPISPGLT